MKSVSAAFLYGPHLCCIFCRQYSFEVVLMSRLVFISAFSLCVG